MYTRAQIISPALKVSSEGSPEPSLIVVKIMKFSQLSLCLPDLPMYMYQLYYVGFTMGG